MDEIARLRAAADQADADALVSGDPGDRAFLTAAAGQLRDEADALEAAARFEAARQAEDDRRVDARLAAWA